jgi:excinuclease ABC subunit A
VRARVDGELIDISEAKPLEPGKSHTIEAIVDRIVMKEGIESRLRESIDLACRESDGTCIISHEANGQWTEKLFSTRFSCPACNLNFPTPEPRSFSFGSPWGACQECSGLGVRGAINQDGPMTTFHQEPCPSCEGTRLQPFPRNITFQNVSLPQLSRQSVDEALQTVRRWCAELDKTHVEPLTQEAVLVAERTLPDIEARLKCLSDVGIGYLTLDRPARTLSGGEFQRARLAASLSSQLYGAHFVLDEPTAGLHPRDTNRLLTALFGLRDAGGTVIVVEHDGEIMRAADWLVDLGPGAGADGGLLLFSGTPDDAERLAQSPTGDYLRGQLERRGQPDSPTKTAPSIDAQKSKATNQTADRATLTIRNARLHNLQSIDVVIPLHQLVCVTGVSGSGKSSLIFGTLLPVISAFLIRDRNVDAAAADARCDGIDGMDQIRRVLSLDQSPLGRSSRSCIATLCGLWDEVRRLFAKTRDARAKGLSSRHFSFNSGEGRCPECRGTGIRNVRMNFLPDAIVPCPLCNGMRFSKMVNSICFREKSVGDVLQMRVDEACEFFSEFDRLHGVLDTFRSVGLGYLSLGQPATTFSGGEAQRAKLASELARPSSEHTLYVLDEPTSGLHPADVNRLLIHLRRLVDVGHSVIVIEHQLDVIRQADWVLDIGPDCADLGGKIVFEGSPTDLMHCQSSLTGQALR